MPGRGGRKGGEGLTDGGKDFVTLVLDYAKQETVGPLKVMGRFVLWGVLGSIFLAIGLAMLLLALLRLLQTETGVHLRGNWSWAPYLLTTVIAVVVAVLMVLMIRRGPARKRTPETKGKGKS